MDARSARTYTHGPRRESCNMISADWRPYTMKKHRLASEHTGITDWRLNTLKQQGKKNSRIFSYMPGEQSKIYLSLYASSRWRPIPRRFRDAAVCNVDVHFSTSWWRRAEDLVLHFSQEDQRWLVHLPPFYRKFCLWGVGVWVNIVPIVLAGLLLLYLLYVEWISQFFKLYLNDIRWTSFVTKLLKYVKR